MERQSSTYPFIDIPTPVLSTLGGLDHTLVGLKVPVEMAGFFLLGFLGGGEPAATSTAFVTLCII